MQKKYWLILSLTLFVVVIGAAAFTAQNAALASTTIIVNTTNDELNADSDCSLREAIIAANSDIATSGCAAGSGDDTIEIDVFGMVNLWTDLPAITSHLSIIGPDADRFAIGYGQINLSNPSRGFIINGAHTVNISGLKISFVEADFGAGVWNAGGTITLDDVYIQYAHSDSDGSAIHSTGTLTITNSLISQNAVDLGGVGGIWSDGMLTLANTVVVGNNGASSSDIKIVSGSASFVNATIGTIEVDGGAASFKNTIVSGCVLTSGTINSLGHNIDSDAGGGCGFSIATSDLPNGTDPKFLTRYKITSESVESGISWTTLAGDSPAIDAGDNAACAAAPVNNQDIRGETRPSDGDSSGSVVCDIGAYELRVDPVPQAEYDALVALYNATDGVNWSQNSGWLTDPSPCRWFGVTCKNGHIVELALNSNWLDGTIPPEIADLTHLEYLNLSFNYGKTWPYQEEEALRGSIPPEIGSLTNLRELWLNNNFLSGEIPPELGDLTNLEILQLGRTPHLDEPQNNLTGSIPSELGVLTNLRLLILADLPLTGSIPSELGDLTNLQELWLDHTQISGSIPTSFGDLTKLTWLILMDNQLNGAIPSSLGSLSRLEVLALHRNQLSTSIPTTLGNLSNAYYFFLSDNQLTGAIPPQLGNLTSVREFWLGNNQLTGSIPSQIGNLSKVVTLDLAQNHLSGTIPTSLGGLTNLTWLGLGRNQLGGTIPPQIGDLTQLMGFSLEKNQLIGPIPFEITNLVNLSEPSFSDDVDFGYNMLFTNDETVRDFLDIKDPGWSGTQTLTPTDVVTGTATQNAIMLNWTPIAYTEPPGYYEVWYSLSAAGPFSQHGVTANKSASGYNAGSLLLGTTYYFQVRTVTPIHDSQQNLLMSDFSPVVSGTTSTGSSFCSGVSEIPLLECEALVALYTSTNGPAWTNHNNWLVSPPTPCSWAGVGCSGGHVTIIGLSSNNLVGVIPSQIGNLTELTSLVLDNNQLTGSIPSKIGNLTDLFQILINDNQLSGAIPSSLGNLTNLLFLQAWNNQLSGNIPPQLGNLTNLSNLVFDRNQLSGTIPPDLGNLSSLLILGLSENHLTGIIPSELEGLSSVQVILLHNNQLSGTIPASLGNLATLNTLFLHNNKLIGEIPSTITQLTHLAVDDISPQNLFPWLGDDEVDFGFNGLYSTDPVVITFLDSKDVNWASSQTIAPSDVQVVTPTGVNSIELAWTPIPYTGDGGRYQIWYSTSAGGPFTLHGNTANKFATGYTAGGLQPNTTYYFVVRTFTPLHGEQQNAITSGDSNLVNGTTDVAGLNAPSNLNVISSSQTDTDLSWNDHSSDEDSFHIERSPDGINGWTEIDTVGVNITAYTDSGLTCDTTYFYRVRGFRSGDGLFSAFTNIASAKTYLCPPPGTPDDVTATGVSLTQIDVTWTDTADDEDSFHIERSPDGTNNWQEVGSVGADVMTFANTDLLCNRLYYYRVRAFRDSDDQYSFYSNTASGSTQPCLPPNQPALMSAVGEGINRITLTWQDNSLDESGFSIEMRPDGTLDFTRIAIVPANQTTYTHEGLLCGTTYFYRVRAYRSSDGQYSLPSVVLDGTTLECPPPVPNTAGLYQNGAWLFRDTNSTGTPDVAFVFGPREAGWTALVGDWDGDGVDGIGLYKDGLWMLRNSASSGQRDLAFKFNPLGAGAVPVVGDWNGDGVDTIGLYKDGLWVIRNSNSAGQHDLAFKFNPGGTGWQPLAGDWNGDQYDTVGLYREGRWYLINVLETVTVASGFKFGPPQPGWTAIVGDWNMEGIDTIGLYKDGVWRLRNSNDEGGVDVGFNFLPGAKGWTPVAGYRGGMAGLGSLDLGNDPTLNPTLLPLLPTATPETITPEVTDIVTPEVTDSVIVPSETPTPTEEMIIPTPTEVVTEVPPSPTPTETPTETVMPEVTETP